MEVRRLRSTTRLNAYLDWPGVKQVCLIERVRRRNGHRSVETVCAITSLDPSRASAARLLRIARDRWTIENRLHWVRDVSLGEDSCRVRSGEAPRILAAMRNATLYLLRVIGIQNIAAALRHHAAKPREAVALVTDLAPT